MNEISTTLVATGVWEDAELQCAEVTLEPGASTGWHYHDGPLLAAVRAGTLTQYDARGVPTVRGEGTCFVEPPGPAHVHVGVNRGPGRVVLLVTYVVPRGAPLRVDVDPPETLVSMLLPL